ncbi:MAG: hypothetical protein N7Q72_03885 [Spiroplasma sp. Tabriz.8]|nr:hypothetical protein [Candidatus Regiella insecticola]MCZ8632385.1 hypothetical protein [Spiroplasma sp. Tabriz.8]
MKILMVDLLKNNNNNNNNNNKSLVLHYKVYGNVKKQQNIIKRNVN